MKFLTRTFWMGQFLLIPISIFSGEQSANSYQPPKEMPLFILTEGSETPLDCDRCALRRIFAFITLGDCAQACGEARVGLEKYPKSKEMWKALLLALAKSGDEKGMVLTWEKFIELFPEEAENRSILENMAWGVIEKEEHSSSPIVRTYCLLGAFMGQDARGVEILERNLSDPNARLRAISIKLASNLRDTSLQNKVFSLFKTERNCDVWLEAISAVGKMKILEAQPGLVAIVANDKSRAEEKAAAMESLVNLFETSREFEVEQLSKSNRAGLRELACKVVAHVGEPKDIVYVIPLLKDHCADVRCAALQALRTPEH